MNICHYINIINIIIFTCCISCRTNHWVSFSLLHTRYIQMSIYFFCPTSLKTELFLLHTVIALNCLLAYILFSCILSTLIDKSSCLLECELFESSEHRGGITTLPLACISL